MTLIRTNLSQSWELVFRRRLAAWLKRHALANYCPNNLRELQTTARNKLKSAQKRPSIIAACLANKRRFDDVIHY